jgi:parallel beta-helix repeat protein
VLIEGCQFIEKRGTGLWFDLNNDGCEVRNCLLTDNHDAGIFSEISFALNAHDNAIIGYGLNDSAGAWGASSGIALSSSPRCTIERNLIMGNTEGFDFREQGRTTPRLGAPKGTPRRRYGTMTRPSAATSSPTTATPRPGAGSTSTTAATGRRRCRSIAPMPGRTVPTSPRPTNPMPARSRPG